MNIIERMGGSNWFLTIAPKFVPQVDRFVHKITGGRVILTSLYIPVLLLHSIGRKSGQERSTPIATMPDGDNWVIVGSNYGRENHPAWTYNLIANPDARVEFKGKTYAVKAHMASPEEKATLWPRIVKVWPNFDKYSERSGGRELRVFILERQ